MVRFFWTKTNPPITAQHVRDLQPGYIVKFANGGTGAVDRLEVTADYIGGAGKSARAIKVHFVGHDPVIAHPDDEIRYF